MEGKRTKETTAGSISLPTGHKIGGPLKITQNPGYIAERIKIFEEIYKKQQEQLASIEKREIDIMLKDGKVIKGKSWETTPADIAKKISKKLLESSVAALVVYTKKDPSAFASGKQLIGYFDLIDVADVDDCAECTTVEKGEIYDLGRPLEGDCTLELISFDDPAGKTVTES